MTPMVEFQYISVLRNNMKSINKFIKESSEDGLNGHWQDFIDEETGEIVTMWVDDPTPEELERQEEERRNALKSYLDKCDKERQAYKELNIDSLEDQVWYMQQELKDLHDEYRQLQIDQEEELGPLYTDGKEAEAEKLAQKYGKQFNKNSKKQETLKKKLGMAQKRLNIARNKMWKIRSELWG